MWTHGHIKIISEGPDPRNFLDTRHQWKLDFIQGRTPNRAIFNSPSVFPFGHPVCMSWYWQRTPNYPGPAAQSGPHYWQSLLKFQSICLHLDLVLPFTSLPGWAHMSLLQLNSDPRAWFCWGVPGRPPMVLASWLPSEILLASLPASCLYL